MDDTPRTILATGATGGIGRAVCQRLAEGGAPLLLVARGAARLQSLCADLPVRGPAQHAWISVNMTLDDSVQQFAEALSERQVILVR
jgi:3-oxoacyl-[acyl-carrier protein] reductase